MKTAMVCMKTICDKQGLLCRYGASHNTNGARPHTDKKEVNRP